jgi:thymidylate synthase (FAD)
MKVVLMAHTFLSDEFIKSINDEQMGLEDKKVVDAEIVALTAIRTCYSHLKPSEILEVEGEKYFSEPATDGEGGRESDRLFRHITKSGHTSTLEHINYTFLIEGVSRSLLAQITRHRHLSFSVQSQRYVRMGSEDKSGGFGYVNPPSLEGKVKEIRDDHDEWPDMTADEIFQYAMEYSQRAYDDLRKAGVPPEDARMVLPNAAVCNIVMTGNLRTMLDFYKKRKTGKGAQWEIADLATRLKDKIVKVDSWTDAYFGG